MGRRQGAVRGRRIGAANGHTAGGNEVERRLTAIARAAEEQRQREAEAQAAERAANCGAPLFVSGYCPTDDEIARENSAESLCGPGTAEGKQQAAEQGIQC
jgi:hypothetical protein